MKKILFLIRTLNMGGAEHVLVDIANHMAKDGYSVTVQTMIDEGCYRDRLEPNVHYQGGFKSSSIIAKKIAMRLYLMLPGWFWGKTLIKSGYTHLVAFTEGYPTKIIAGYHKHHAKKIAWVHTDLFSNYQSKFVFGTEENNRECYEHFDRIICVSGDAKRGYEKRIGQHRCISVQYNPINKSKIIELSKLQCENLHDDSNVFRIVAVGRLVSVKGFDLLIEAISIAKKSLSRPVKLYIIGGGSEEEHLRQLMIEYGLEDMISLCGQQTNPYGLMSKCDMQVISSRAEGYPLVLCEGHFLGLPAVATKCSGPIEILSSSNGGLLVDLSAEALAEGIVRMVNDEMLFAACKKNVQKWSDAYDVDVIYKQIESLFD